MWCLFVVVESVCVVSCFILLVLFMFFIIYFFFSVSFVCLIGSEDICGAELAMYIRVW